MEESDDGISVLHNSSVDDDDLNGNGRLVTDKDIFENDMLDHFCQMLKILIFLVMEKMKLMRSILFLMKFLQPTQVMRDS
eukprot:11159957-Ditylum_brightwellii.AAC.1